jgi:hypothetical protein
MTKNLVIFFTFFQSGVMPLDLLKNTNFLIIYMYVSVNHLRRMPSDGKSSHCLWQGELKM